MEEFNKRFDEFMDAHREEPELKPISIEELRKRFDALIDKLRRSDDIELRKKWLLIEEFNEKYTAYFDSYSAEEEKSAQNESKSE